MPKIINGTCRRSLLTALALSSALIGGVSLASADPTTIKIAYSADYLMSSPDLAKKWFDGIKANYEKKDPSVKVELVPIQGGYDDFLTKLTLMYNNAGSGPDIAGVPAPEIGQWVASDLLAPLDDRLSKESGWSQYVEPVKQEGSID